MVVNFNSIVSPNKRALFHSLVDDHKPDIIFGSESKLDPSIPTYSVFPDNYLVHQKHGVAGGGGVFLAVRGGPFDSWGSILRINRLALKNAEINKLA